MLRNHNTDRQATVTRFVLGETFITPGAEEALMIAGQTPIEFLRRHICCDFGELSDDDFGENELSLKEGFRLLSAYHTAKGQKLFGSLPRLIAARQLSSFHQNTDLPKTTRRECFSHSRRREQEVSNSETSLTKVISGTIVIPC
jgi:hypothetical protein